MKTKCKHEPGINGARGMTFSIVGATIFDKPTDIYVLWCSNCGAIKAPLSGNKWKRPKTKL